MTAVQNGDSPSADEPQNDAERELMAAAAIGSLANAGCCGHGQAVRADFLAGLLTGDLTPSGGCLRSVKLRDALITGQLDLEARKLRCPLLLRDCRFIEPINLNEAEAVSIRLPGCRILALTAAQLRTIGDVELSDGFDARGEISLVGARICGNLILSGATLTNHGGTALNANSLQVDQNVYFLNGFTAHGEINMTGARIEGEFDLTGATITNPQGRALYFQRLTVNESMSINGECKARGEVNLNGAHIGGDLQFGGADFASENGIALNAHGLTVEKNMRFDRNFTATGRIGIAGADIRGRLLFNKAAITNDDSTALLADGLTVSGNMSFFRFTARGEINLVGASIGGQLSFEEATLTNSKGSALEARHLTTGLNLECKDGFSVHGKIHLRNANISGLLDLARAEVQPITRWAIDLEQANMGNLHLPNSRPEAPAKINPVDAGKSARRFYGIDLTNARTRTFSDHEEGWPDALRIRGFIYDRLDDQDANVHARLRWLRLHPQRFTPQIYDQLADAYRRVGDDSAARRVLIAKQWRRRRPYNPLSWLWRVTVGYGYRTGFAFAWAVVLAIVGSATFGGAFFPVHMAQSIPQAPPFQPIIYTLDVLLPIGGLGQKNAWHPTAPGLLYLYWALAVAGWMLSAAVFAGLAGVLKRN